MNGTSAVEGHFAFGENWKSFARVVDDRRIEQAVIGTRRLFPGDELKGARFLDIGCGSGLSSLAALRLGASSVDAIDIDSASVETTRHLLTRHAPGAQWTVRELSVFDLPGELRSLYDVVYSWGVLHHTGDMWRAVECAASMAKPGGMLAIALYRKTPSCRYWQIEKRLYSRSPRFVQAVVSGLFKTAWILNGFYRGLKPLETIRDYHTGRGMSWSHDVHDWLGGYPYESAAAEDVRSRLSKLGFSLLREFVHTPTRGVMGTGCDEFVVINGPG